MKIIAHTFISILLGLSSIQAAESNSWAELILPPLKNPLDLLYHEGDDSEIFLQPMVWEFPLEVVSLPAFESDVGSLEFSVSFDNEKKERKVKRKVSAPDKNNFLVLQRVEESKCIQKEIRLLESDVANLEIEWRRLNCASLSSILIRSHIKKALCELGDRTLKAEKEWYKNVERQYELKAERLNHKMRNVLSDLRSKKDILTNLEKEFERLRRGCGLSYVVKMKNEER